MLTSTTRSDAAMTKKTYEERRGVGPWRVLLFLAAGAITLWALFDPAFRNAEGAISALVCLPLAGAVGLLLCGVTVGTGLRVPGLWCALLLIAQAASLQLMHAGPKVGYQHYALWSELLTGQNAAFTALLAVQLVAVALGLRRYWSAIRLGLKDGWSRWQIAAIGVLLVLSSAVLSREVFHFAGELILASIIQLVAIANVVLVAASIPGDQLERISERFDGVLTSPATNVESPRIDRFAIVVGIGVVVTAALLSLWSYQRHPHVPDEVVYILHARYFAKGLLWLPLPPVADAFNIDLMYYEPTRWFSPVPVGWPAILSVGALLGAAWLVNPILAGINILLVYRFSWELYDRRTARITTLLFALSPWQLFMAMNFMTHTFTLFSALIAATAVARLRRDGGLQWALLGGVGIGLVSLNRPLEGLAIASLLGLWTLPVRGKRFRFAPAFALTLASIAVGALTLPYNRLLTGSATKFPIMMYTDHFYGAGSNALGFGANRGLGWPGLDPFPGHGAIDVLVNASLNTSSIATELFGWSTGSLLLIALLLFSGRARRQDWQMLGAIGVIVGLHSFYWFSGGPDFGARYWYLVIVPCVLLTARAVQLLASRTAELTKNASSAARVHAAVLAVCFAATVTFIPWRAIDKYRHYRGMRPDVRQLMGKHDFGNSVVLIRGNRHPDYASAAVYNPLDLRSGAPVFAWDRGAEVRRELLAAYPNSTFWVVDGPTLTQAGYRIVRGPIPAAQFNPDVE